MSFDSAAYIDIHCHRSEGVGRRILNITLDQMSNLAGLEFSCGIHPWDIEGLVLEPVMANLEHCVSHQGCVAIGECGLDNKIATDIAVQRYWFERQLELARRLCKPVIIHCVKAFNELLAIRQDYPEQIWIVHGFTGGPELARQLLRKGIYLSFGRSLLKGGKAADSLSAVSRDRVFFETDDQVEVSIEQVYQAASTITGVSVPDWQQHILHNFNSVFQR